MKLLRNRVAKWNSGKRTTFFVFHKQNSLWKYRWSIVNLRKTRRCVCFIDRRHHDESLRKAEEKEPRSRQIPQRSFEFLSGFTPRLGFQNRSPLLSLKRLGTCNAAHIVPKSLQSDKASYRFGVDHMDWSDARSCTSLKNVITARLLHSKKR